MKKEVFDKLKQYLKSDTKVEEVEVKAEEVVEETTKLEEDPKEDKKEEPKAEPVYATKDDLLELKKMFLDLLEKMQEPSAKEDKVPEGLSEDTPKEVELAEETEELPEDVVHTPDAEVENKKNIFAPRSKSNTIHDRVQKALFGN